MWLSPGYSGTANRNIKCTTSLFLVLSFRKSVDDLEKRNLKAVPEISLFVSYSTVSRVSDGDE